MILLSEITSQLPQTFVTSTQQSLTAANQKITTLQTEQQALQTQALQAISQTVSEEGDLGTLSWSGTAPSGTVVKKFRWVKTGRIVRIDWAIKASTAGLLNGSVSAPLPAGCPAPLTLSTVTNDSWAVIGDGSILSAINASPLSGQSGLYKNSDGSYSLRITAGVTLAAGAAMGNVEYLTQA